MDWRTENGEDLQLINLRGLAPLDASCVAREDDLVAMIEGHNGRTARAAGRVRELAEDRERLGDFDAWQNADSVDIVSQRSRVRREAWDALLELRRVLEEREAILRLTEARLCEAYGRVSDAYDRAVAAAERRLARQQRALQRANSSTAGSHFADLVAEERTVTDAAAKMNEARAALEAVTDARRGIIVDSSAVKMRQREVFAAMVA